MRPTKILLIRLITACFCLVGVISFLSCKTPSNEPMGSDALLYLRKISAAFPVNDAVSRPSSLNISGNWTVSIILYNHGIERARGMGKDDTPGGAILAGYKNMLYGIDGTARLTKNEIDKARFYVTLIPSQGESVSFIEYNGRAYELADDVTAVREMTKPQLAAHIRGGKEYLLRMMNPEWHAFFKSYDVRSGTGEERLRTVYTASSLYTFLKLSGHEQDDRIDEAIVPIASFLLSMQETEGKHKGAFHYSFFPDSQEKEKRFVVGTASKAIFTLIKLYNTTQNDRYLAAALDAGNWLLSMLREDGSVYPYVKFHDGNWHYGKRFSCLYTGQVLSALSRLYGVTHDTRYLTSAGKIARILGEKAENDNYFLHDEYRPVTDPVPTSWAVMSLLDYYKVTGDRNILEVLQQSAQVLLKLQKKDPRDILNFGRFEGTRSTSGNGWINEVLGELYTYGITEEWRESAKYKEAMILVSRWLIQNTYSPENTYFLQHPEKAFGGLIRNQTEETVRTDAVCHGVNGYIMLYALLPDDFHIEFN